MYSLYRLVTQAAGPVPQTRNPVNFSSHFVFHVLFLGFLGCKEAAPPTAAAPAPVQECCLGSLDAFLRIKGFRAVLLEGCRCVLT